MMTGRRSKKFHAVLNSSAFGIGGAVIKAADPGKRDRCRAHRARFERDIKIAVIEPLGAQLARGLADDDHFGMRGRVAIGNGAVAGARNHLAAADQDAAHRHLGAFASGARFLQRHVHKRTRCHRHDRARPGFGRACPRHPRRCL